MSDEEKIWKAVVEVLILAALAAMTCYFFNDESERFAEYRR